ncbi:unnamed protein product, partial [Closterium sp. NIES-54]
TSTATTSFPHLSTTYGPWHVHTNSIAPIYLPIAPPSLPFQICGKDDKHHKEFILSALRHTTLSGRGHQL